jgi:uncharacterized protein YjbI with pentapeptide repeats
MTPARSKPPIDPEPPDLPADLRTGAAAAIPAVLDRLTLEGAVLERLEFGDRPAADLHLDGCRLTSVDLTGAELGRPLLQDSVVAGGSWENVRARDARLRRVTFTGVRMTGADLPSATIEDTSFTDCRIDLAAFHLAKLTRVRFVRCRLDEADFSAARLVSVAFVDCVLAKSIWLDATLTRCEMRGTDLTGAVNPERLKGVRMPWEDVLASAALWAQAAGVEIVD